MNSGSKRLFPILAFGIPFCVYAWTMADSWALDTIYAIDGAEMIIASHTLGIDHPPGHPLYLILSHLFSRLPFASPDGGVVFTSVLFGALAALFLGLAVRERTHSAPAALGAAWIFAFGFIAWIHATIAEVYALQLAFLGLYVYSTIRWLRTRDARSLYLLAFTLGLGATTNVLLAALLVPSFLYTILRSGAIIDAGEWKAKRTFSTLSWGLLGLTPFLYVPIRLAQNRGFISDFVFLSGYEVLSLRWAWWYLSAEEFTATNLFGVSLSRYPDLILTYLRSCSTNFSPLLPILAAAGVIMAMSSRLSSIRTLPAAMDNRPRAERRKRGREARHSGSRSGLLQSLLTHPDDDTILDTALVIAFICTLLPVLSYDVADRDVFFLPSFFFMAALGGHGLAYPLQAIERRQPDRLKGGVPYVIAAALPIFLFLSHFPEVTRITGDPTRYGERLERFKKLPEGAFIIAEDDGRGTRYKYFQLVHGLRPDVTIETMGRLAPRFRGEIGLDRKAEDLGDLSVGLNVSDRLKILKGLFEAAPDRPTYAVLDDRMPPEFDHFRTVRSPIDPYLLEITPKPPPERSIESPSFDVAAQGRYFEELRFVGFGIEGLDQGNSRTFARPMPLGEGFVDGAIKRGELFELCFAVQRRGPARSKLFGEFAFVNERMEIPTAHGFSAFRNVEVVPEDLPQDGYYKDRFIFKIPGTIQAGLYTLAVRVSRSSGKVQGTYKGKPVRTLTPVRMTQSWKGQFDYRPLGKIRVE